MRKLHQIHPYLLATYIFCLFYITTVQNMMQRNSIFGNSTHTLFCAHNMTTLERKQKKVTFQPKKLGISLRTSLVQLDY